MLFLSLSLASPPVTFVVSLRNPSLAPVVVLGNFVASKRSPLVAHVFSAVPRRDARHMYTTFSLVPPRLYPRPYNTTRVSCVTPSTCRTPLLPRLEASLPAPHLHPDVSAQREAERRRPVVGDLVPRQVDSREGPRPGRLCRQSRCRSGCCFCGCLPRGRSGRDSPAVGPGALAGQRQLSRSCLRCRRGRGLVLAVAVF